MKKKILKVLSKKFKNVKKIFIDRRDLNIIIVIIINDEEIKKY